MWKTTHEKMDKLKNDKNESWEWGHKNSKEFPWKDDDPEKSMDSNYNKLEISEKENWGAWYRENYIHKRLNGSMDPFPGRCPSKLILAELTQLIARMTASCSKYLEDINNDESMSYQSIEQIYE